MASTDPVRGWDRRALIVAESTFGTTPNPAGSQAIECHALDMGPSEVGIIRKPKDKTQGRGMQNSFVEGRVQPIPFSISTAVKSRAAVDTAPKESALYVGAGLVETTNSGVSVVYSIASATIPPGISIYRVFGTGTDAFQAEQGRGGVVKSLKWTVGQQELVVAASGAFSGKYHLGQAAATVADGSTTSVTLDTTSEAYRLGLGWYSWESEIVKVTAIAYGTGVLTMSRAQLSSSGVAHSAKPLCPYVPTLTLAGSPITEQNLSVTIDSVTTLATEVEVDMTTGADHLPGQSGSKYAQGPKLNRIDITVNVSLVLTMAQVQLLGKATQRKNCAITVVCGTGTGGIVTFSFPYTECVAFAVPDVENDVVIVKASFRCRDNSGNDMATITLT